MPSSPRSAASRPPATVLACTPAHGGRRRVGMLHPLADYHLSEGGLRAVCRCGQTGPPRASEERAAALDAQHRLDPLHCGVCEGQRVPDAILCRPEQVGQVIRPAVGGSLPDIEYLACADNLSTYAQLAAQLQKRLARSVAEADAYCRRLRRPTCD